MKSPILLVACALSLVLLGMLACGYFGELELFFRPRAPVVGGLDTFSMLGAGNGGQVYFESVTRQTPPGQTFLSPGIHPILQFRPFRPPVIRRCIWEFDARRLHGDFRTSALEIACPIWCVSLPLLIAPVLWLRKWRKSRLQPSGFSVIEASQRSTSIPSVTPPPSAIV